MAAKSTYLDNAVLAAVLTNVSFTSPTTVYAGLFTTAPTAAYTNTVATGTEVVDTNYTRQAVAFSAPSGGSTANTGTVAFFGAGAAGPGPYTIVAVGILDLGGAPVSSPFGNLLYFGNLTVSKTVSTGDTLQFAMSALAVSES
jgi:hypothetical protein